MHLMNPSIGKQKTKMGLKAEHDRRFLVMTERGQVLYLLPVSGRYQQEANC